MKRYNVLFGSDIDRDSFFAEIQLENGEIVAEFQQGSADVSITIYAYEQMVLREPYDEFLNVLHHAYEWLVAETDIIQSDEIAKKTEKILEVETYSVKAISLPTKKTVAEIWQNNRLIALVMQKMGLFELELYPVKNNPLVANYEPFIKALLHAKHKILETEAVK